MPNDKESRGERSDAPRARPSRKARRSAEFTSGDRKFKSPPGSPANQRFVGVRIQAIDGARGLAVILMVIHHALYNAAAFLGAPWWVFTNPVFDVLHYIFAGLFIFLAGVSSRFSRSNLKRGLLCALAAGAVTGATYLVGVIDPGFRQVIRFGILHLLASCMLLYALAASRLFDALRTRRTAGGTSIRRTNRGQKSAWLWGILWVALIIAAAFALEHLTLSFPLAWLFGWRTPGFRSADYFPLLPWIFVFALGAWAGYYIKERKLPERFYTQRVPFFPIVGRRALIIYLLHQPVLYGLTVVIQLTIDNG